MDKKRPALIAAGILVMIFILVSAGNIRKIKGAILPNKSQAAIAVLPVKQVEPLFKSKIIDVKKEGREIGWGRDPFMRQELVTGQVETVANLKLMGITTGKSAKPMAIINNKLVSVGSRIGKFRIMEISKEGVWVTDDKEVFELKMQ